MEELSKLSDVFVSVDPCCLIALYGWLQSVSVLEFFCKLSLDFLNNRLESDWAGFKKVAYCELRGEFWLETGEIRCCCCCEEFCDAGF